MKKTFDFYPEFSKELQGVSRSSLIYGLIIKESEKNYKAVKNLSCEGSAKWIQKKIGYSHQEQAEHLRALKSFTAEKLEQFFDEYSERSIFRGLKTLRDKKFIRQEALEKKDRSYKDGCHITYRYIPLILPETLKDKYKEVV